MSPLPYAGRDRNICPTNDGIEVLTSNTMKNRADGTMRVATLLLCLTLAGCAAAGGKLPGEQPAPQASAASDPVPPASAQATAKPANPRPAAQAGRPQPAASPAPASSPPAEVSADMVTQARVNCWMAGYSALSV